MKLSHAVVAGVTASLLSAFSFTGASFADDDSSKDISNDDFLSLSSLLMAESGCADGTREGFINASRYPTIAGCSGAWNVPGIHHPEGPACGRSAGNNGQKADGIGCNVEDLCATGWHVCTGNNDLRAHAPAGCKGVLDNNAAPAFFLTRESSSGSMKCDGDVSGEPPADRLDDLFGCGNLGCLIRTDDKHCTTETRTSHESCMSLKTDSDCTCRNINGSVKCEGQPGCNWCETVAYFETLNKTKYPDAWQCPDFSHEEAALVTKTNSEYLGGVLCCKD